MKFITYNKAHHARLWRFALLLLAAATVVMLIATLWRDRDVPVANFFSPSVVLAAPSSQLPASFPSSSFNMSGYLDTGQPLDLDKITALYPTKRLVGSGYVVVSAGSPAHPNSLILYASDDGWLVASFESNTSWLSSLGEWSLPSGETLYSHSTSFETLTSVIEAAVAALNNGSDASGISYYHWGYQTATKVIVFSRSTYGLPTTMSFTIPDSVTVLQASWSAEGCAYSWPSYGSRSPEYSFYLDGMYICKNNFTKRGSFDPAVSVEHNIELNPRRTTDKLGIAVYLLIE